MGTYDEVGGIAGDGATGGVPARPAAVNPETYGCLLLVWVVKIPDARNPDCGTVLDSMSTDFTIGPKLVRR